MTDIFLSYKQTDRERVRPFAEGLEAEGFSVWWDAAIPLGQTYYSAIETQLAAAKVVIPVWTEESIGSEWVREEATKGKHQNKLLPVKLDDVEPPVGFSTIQTADLSKWSGDRDAPEWRTIVSHVRQISGANPTPQPIKPKVKPARKNTNAFGGDVAPEPKKKAGWKTYAIAAAVVVVGLGILNAVTGEQQNAVVGGPSPYYNPPGYNNGQQPTPNDAQIQAAESQAYNVALQMRNRSAYEAFLKMYPQSGYAPEIQKHLSSCRMEQQASASSAPVTATGWAVYQAGGCSQAQVIANGYLQQACLNYSQSGQVSNPQYQSGPSVDQMGNPICVVQAAAACNFAQGSNASYEVCQ